MRVITVVVIRIITVIKMRCVCKFVAIRISRGVPSYSETLSRRDAIHCVVEEIVIVVRGHNKR